jgi:lactate 2-monooxygenase
MTERTLWLSTLEAYEALEQRAAEVLDPVTFEFVSSGPNHGAGIRLYREAFARQVLVPRPLTPAGAPDLTVELLGTTYASPLMIAPTGFVGRLHPECEVAVARAARPREVPMMCSTYTAQRFEDICEALGEVPRWFQLYWVGGRAGAEKLLERAEAGGAAGIAVTVDTSVIPMRPEAMLGEFGDQLADDPLDRRPSARLDPDAVARRARASASAEREAMTPDDLRWLCDATTLPVLAKGVLSAEAALQMLDLGVDGVVVSNHGGQLLDSGIASLDALPDVRAAVGAEVPVLFDSGIRTGSDVVKALALGADAVLVGRPCLFGLAVDGEAGVGRVLDDLLRDLSVVLGGIGCKSVGELDASCVQRVEVARAP